LIFKMMLFPTPLKLRTVINPTNLPIKKENSHRKVASHANFFIVVSGGYWLVINNFYN